MSKAIITYDQDGNPLSEARLAELEAGRERFNDKPLMMLDEAVGAIYDGEDTAALVERISDISCRLSSEHRLPNLLEVWGQAPPDVFWASLASEWSMCDDTWADLDDLLEIMREYRQWAPARRYLGRSLRVYRGCARDRVLGIAWTTDRAVAENFAHGHRGIRNPDPVIATAMVSPGDIFLRLNDRGEREVLLDPELLRDVRSKSTSSR
jgi:hypothetical protein